MLDDREYAGKKALLYILHAGNIGKLLGMVAVEFRKQSPDVEVLREKGGSVDLVKKVSMQDGNVDIVATADYKNIDDFLYGKYTDWYVMFATTSMVLAYTDKSQYSDLIAVDNWHEIVSKPSVRIMWGDPDVDPGAYRRIMIGKLAEKYYGQSGLSEKIEANVIRPDRASHAVPLARKGQVDYMFMYKPAAIANGLRYLELPPQVDLSDPSFIDLYRSVDVISSGVRVKGDVITYGIAVPNNAIRPDLALMFIKLLLSPTGTKIIQDCGFVPIKPFKTKGCVPQMLKGLY